MSGNRLSFLTVKIAGQIVALDVNAVQAVLPMDDVVPVPLAPPAVVGIATKRGHVLTVIDARASITSTAILDTQQSVVVHINGYRYALLVDAIDEVVSVDPSDIGPPPPGMQDVWASLATGAIRIDAERLALVVRLERFVEVTENQATGLNYPLTPDALEVAHRILGSA